MSDMVQAEIMKDDDIPVLILLFYEDLIEMSGDVVVDNLSVLVW